MIFSEAAASADTASLTQLAFQWGPAVTAIFLIMWLFSSGRLIGKAQADQLRETADRNHEAMLKAIETSLTAIAQVERLQVSAQTIDKVMSSLQERLDYERSMRYTGPRKDDET